MKYILMIMMVVLFALGCSNPDGGVSPPLPNEGTYAPDPDIPVPFVDYDGGAILDIAFEKDGDCVLAMAAGGLRLYDPFGARKWFPQDGGVWQGLVDANGAILNSGIGILGLTQGVDWRDDDMYVDHSPYFPIPRQWWWGGAAHPPPTPNFTATSGDFGITGPFPIGIDVHPFSGWLFMKVSHGYVNLDGDAYDPDVLPIGGPLLDGIIAISPSAPGIDGFYDGGIDYVVYHNKSDVDRIDSYGNAAASAAMEIFCWDPTNPFSMLPPRPGIGTQNVADFEFDSIGGLVLSIPYSNAIAITNPITFDEFGIPQMIVVQRIVGGANDGTSHQPGDFYGPTGIAIEPGTQEIYVSDTGLDRVQVFDNQGNFIRMFPVDNPRAIRLDTFTNIYIATSDPYLSILNRYGEPIVYGSIEGYVKDKKTGVALDNVAVSISSTYLDYTTTTDGNGHFIFPVIPQGGHTLMTNRDGYLGGNADVSVKGGQRTTVTIYMDRTGIGESGYGDVTGKLMSSIDGDQLPGLLVTIKGIGITDTSSGDGTFHLYNVPAGDQILEIYSDSILFYEQDITVVSDSVMPLGFIYLPL